MPRHYNTMPLANIMAMPVAEAAAKDCALFLWTTKPMLPAALNVGQAWGFKYENDSLHVGQANQKRQGPFWHGALDRANPEPCLLFTMGSPKRLSKSVRELIEAPVREHSRKPNEVYARIEQLVAGPYLELFARTRRDSWDH